MPKLLAGVEHGHPAAVPGRRRRRGRGDHDHRHGAEDDAVVRAEGWTVGGMAKGAGMLAPGLATMLCVLTTDAVADASVLDEALAPGHGRDVRPGRLGRLPVHQRHRGAAGQRRLGHRRPSAGRTDRGRHRRLPRPGHGSCSPTPRGPQRTSRSTCAARLSEADAVEVGRAVARSNLVKTALYGNDPNWGRILAAVGTTAGRVRAGRPGRGHQRRVGVPGRRRGRRPVQGGPGRPGGAHHGRPRRRRPTRRRCGPTTCRSRTCTRTRRTRREPTSTSTISPRDLGIALGKANTLIEALPWLARFHGGARRDQVRRPRHDRHRAAAGLRRRPGVPALRRAQAGRRARRRAADLVHARPARPASEFRGGLRVTTPEAIDVVRMVLVGQVGRQLVGLINEHGPFAVGMSGRGRTAVHRRAAAGLCGR